MKAIALLSGGLDSTLALKVILDQGIKLIAVNFATPFCQCNRKNGCKSEAKKVVDKFGIELKVFYITDEYFEVIKSPKYGYGSNLNPCIDCRILMYKKAANYMKEINASFVVTGEVLGQRPMSQHKKAMDIIEEQSGLKGLIVRPLSAKLLPLTIPEKKGWIDRNKLLDINGRSRKQQISLASKYEISDYPCPAGGCLLTDAGFSRRMRDLMDYKELSVKEINLLKVGRHFRISSKAKLVVGRDEGENNRLSGMVEKGDLLLNPVDTTGPLAVGRGEFSDEDILCASSIVARYSDGDTDNKLKISAFKWPNNEQEEVLTNIIEKNKLEKLRI